MTISNFQVQNILKAYRVQSALKSRQAREKASKNIIPNDQVNFSAESKKRLLTDKIVQGIVKQVLKGDETNETVQDALNRLSQEYGKSLEMNVEDGETFSFKVLDPQNGDHSEPLPASENEKLKKRLVDLTEKIIYDNLVP
jgi:hypothetical protein